MLIEIIYLNYEGYVLIAKKAECKSGEKDLGTMKSIKQCMKACETTDGCYFFKYGYGKEEGRCFWEKATSIICEEGWEKKPLQFNFYALSDYGK